ncbi:MFS transporter [Agaribacter flavus]|uniref:MFS transporter n=1 Tax=Agaribacter flavus TaxID=1902781 RepID=A0ABV7FTP6_9ALTE
MKLSLKEKAGYACGDIASNFYWRVFDVFLFIFYTDVFGIPAAAVGTMMLVTRIIDAFTDPMMGALSDRTNTKWGKYRPYLIWGIIPIAAAGVLTFTVPDLNDGGKLIWAYCTYIFMMLAYTFINVPYGALLGVITQDTQQRTTLSSFRFVGAFSGGTIVAFMTPFWVESFGGDNEVLGWQLTMGLYGLIAGGLFFVTFLTCKERVQAPKKQAKPQQDILDLFSNKPWLILFCIALIIMLTISIRGSVGTFYFKYVLEREDLIGMFSGAYLISLGIGAAATPLLTSFIDKRRLLITLMLGVTLLSVLFYFIPSDSVILAFAIQIGIGLCLGPKSPLVFSMYADTADYSEWKNGRRSTAMVFAAAAFSQKLGGAIAGATIGYVLGYLGYTANAEQNAGSIHGIVLLMTLIPGFFAFLSIAFLYFYNLDDAALAKYQQELDERRRDPEYQ